MIGFALYKYLFGEVEVVRKSNFLFSTFCNGQSVGHKVYLTVLKDFEHLVQVLGHPELEFNPKVLCETGQHFIFIPHGLPAVEEIPGGAVSDKRS